MQNSIFGARKPDNLQQKSPEKLDIIDSGSGTPRNTTRGSLFFASCGICAAAYPIYFTQ